VSPIVKLFGSEISVSYGRISDACHITATQQDISQFQKDV